MLLIYAKLLVLINFYILILKINEQNTSFH